MVKTTEKERAAILSLYRDKKFSMQKIASLYGLSVSSVRYHLERNDVPRRNLNEAITSWHITEYHKKEFKLNEKLSAKESRLKLAGVMLYWGEGAKINKGVQFVNSNPDMIIVFLCFLRVVCGIHEERLRALVHMYPDHKEKDLISFWSKITKIPKKQFHKSHVHAGRLGTYKSKSAYGTLAVTYSDKLLLDQILLWLEDYKRLLPA